MLSLRKRSKYLVLLFIFVISFAPVWAAGPPAPSLFSNPLALLLIVLMTLLMIIIGVLGNVLIGTADFRRNKKKNISKTAISVILLFLLMSQGSAGFAQEVIADTSKTAATTIGGISSFAFYLMSGIIFFELTIIIIMLINIRLLLKSEKVKAEAEVLSEAEVKWIKNNRLSWWDKMNRLRPVSQEAELDLGHEYDGIRELNNKLPPWWLYGFYVTIIFAGIYLWRFHVTHDGPSGKEEFETSVAIADLKIKEYLKAKGDAVDENTVTLLTSGEDLADGKVIFIKSCASCHTETGAGNVGPNLTDDYWLHGNDIKSVFKTIRYGINAMPQWQNSYSNKEMAKVASYVKSLHGTHPPNAKEPQGTEMKEEPIQVNPNIDSLKDKDGKIAMQN